MGVAFSSFKERPAIMKHIVPHDLVEMKSRTMTSLLIRMMIKSCLLPVSLNFEKNVVRFNFCMFVSVFICQFTEFTYDLDEHVQS